MTSNTTSSATSDTTSNAASGVPDPADYARIAGHAEMLRALRNSAEYDQAFGSDEFRDLRERARRGRLVTLPTDDVQLGARWALVLGADQIAEANARGMFDQALAGADPDRAGIVDRS